MAVRSGDPWWGVLGGTGTRARFSSGEAKCRVDHSPRRNDSHWLFRGVLGHGLLGSVGVSSEAMLLLANERGCFEKDDLGESKHLVSGMKDIICREQAPVGLSAVSSGGFLVLIWAHAAASGSLP